jgi:hypothetical protein
MDMRTCSWVLLLNIQCFCYYTKCSSLSRADGNVVFDAMNLNTPDNWYPDQPIIECKEVPVLCLQQLEKNTIFLGLERILANNYDNQVQSQGIDLIRIGTIQNLWVLNDSQCI